MAQVSSTRTYHKRPKSLAWNNSLPYLFARNRAAVLIDFFRFMTNNSTEKMHRLFEGEALSRKYGNFN